MPLDLPLFKPSTREQALSFLEPKIWTKISHSHKNVKTTTSFTRTLKGESLKNLFREIA